MLSNCPKYLCLTALTMAPSLVASETIVDFEDPPYAIGDLAGQDGWQKGEGNETFITILGPQGGSISDSQSASIRGGAGGVSAYKNEMASFKADGTAAYDINARFLYRKTQSAGFGGLSISNDGSGDSSAGVRVNGTTIEALKADGTYVNLGTGTYDLFDDIVEFSLDIDVDTSVYRVSMRNDSSGETVFTPLTETPLALQGLLAADNVAIMISGQLGQSIYDEITLEQASAVVPLPPAVFLFGSGLAFLGLAGRLARRRA